MDIKQVIVYRRDLKMRKGKIAAQVAHASMKVFFDRMVEGLMIPGVYGKVLVMPLTDEMYEWATTLFGKIVLSVENEADLLRVYELAQAAGIPTALITDAGRTEFKKPCPVCVDLGLPPGGQEIAGRPTGPCLFCEGTGKVPNPTHTTVALGPARAEDIDRITGPDGAVKCKLA